MSKRKMAILTIISSVVVAGLFTLIASYAAHYSTGALRSIFVSSVSAFFIGCITMDFLRDRRKKNPPPGMSKR